MAPTRPRARTRSHEIIFVTAVVRGVLAVSALALPPCTTDAWWRRCSMRDLTKYIAVVSARSEPNARPEYHIGSAASAIVDAALLCGGAGGRGGGGDVGERGSRVQTPVLRSTVLRSRVGAHMLCAVSAARTTGRCEKTAGVNSTGKRCGSGP